MNQLPTQPPSPPTLEMLLRLKRAERPDSAFWTEFEQGLRQKQLAAIVEPKPWWLGLRLSLRRPAPWIAGLTAGAAAVFMFAFTSSTGNEGSGLRVASAETAIPTPFRSMPDEAGQTSRVDRVTSASVVVASVDTPVSGLIENNLRLKLGERMEATRLTAVSDAVVGGEDGDVLAAIKDQTSEAVTALAVADALQVATATTLVVNSDQETLLKAVPSALEWLSGEGTAFAFDTAALVSLVEGEAPVLVQAESDRLGPQSVDARQARLLATIAETDGVSSSQALAQVRDQVIHRMGGNDELYASISRLGVSGDRLSVSF